MSQKDQDPGEQRHEHAPDAGDARAHAASHGHSGEGAASAMAQMISEDRRHRQPNGDRDDAPRRIEHH